MTNSSDPQDRLYQLAGTVAGALSSVEDGTATADQALDYIRGAYLQFEDAVRAERVARALKTVAAAPAVAAAEVPDELAPPGWTTTPGGYQVPADLDDDPALWTGEDRSPEGGAS